MAAGVGKSALDSNTCEGAGREVMSGPVSGRPVLAAVAATALAAAPSPASAEGRRPSGFTVSADLGGGGDLSGPTGVFEMEIAGGYALGAGWALELGLELGVAPGNYFGLRPGLHWSVPATPFYARLAFDSSGQRGSLEWRWLLLGAGAELRFTDVAGGFVEADTGAPLSSGFGVPLLARAGVFFSF